MIPFPVIPVFPVIPIRKSRLLPKPGVALPLFSCPGMSAKGPDSGGGAPKMNFKMNPMGFMGPFFNQCLDTEFREE